MATTSLNGSLRGTYKYNARHQLIRRVVTNSGTGNDGATHYVHDLAGNIIAEIDDTGATVREYIWLPDAGYAGLHLPLAVVSAAATYYVHADHLSRPVRMTDAGKATVWSVTWDAWGSGIPTGPAVLDARLPGQWFQIESGLHYNWHRQYDPSLGRYTQPDPLGFVDGPSVYGYGRGRPLQRVDLDGRYTLAPPIPHPITLIPPVVLGCYALYKYWQGGGGGGNRKDKDDDDDDDCKREWREARQLCIDELSKPNPSNKITGGYRNIMDCSRGLVSERCGGNRIDWGNK